MANAAFTSLVTQASLSLINNQGNLGAVLKDLGSSSALKSLATAVVTAGLLQGISSTDTFGGLLTKDTDLLGKIQNATVNGLAKSVVNTAAGVVISGQPISSTLRSQLLTAAAGVIGPLAAGEIGDLAYDGKISEAVQYMTHAALGCGLSSMSGGDCASGATGAVIGEITGKLYALMTSEEHSQAEIQGTLEEWERKGVDIAKLSAAFGAFVSGLDVNLAADAGANAAENNAMKHIARPLDAAVLKYIFQHSATEFEGDDPGYFPDDIRAALGEPVLLQNGKYGYVLEHLQDNNGNLVFAVNDTSKSGSTINAYNQGSYTQFGETIEDSSAEFEVMRTYIRIKDVVSAYPSNWQTFLCAVNLCPSGLTNSNTVPDQVMAQSGQPIVETGGANVPGSFRDSQNRYRDLSSLLSAIKYSLSRGALSGGSYE